MTRYLIRRALQSLALLLLISMSGFALYHLAPNSPFSEPENLEASDEDARALAEKWGLTDPLPVQYARWLAALLRGDFGRSYFTREPVIQMIGDRLPATVTLAGTSLILGFLIGIPLGIYAGLHRGSLVDRAILTLTVGINAIPDWYLGLLLLLFFGSFLGWLPLGGMATINAPFDIWDRLKHLILPAMVLATGAWLGLSRFLRSETIEVLNQDYVRTARSKGLSEGIVLYKHVLRNSMIPVITSLSGLLAGLVSGAVLIENTFSWPGMGRLALEAAFKRDFPVMLALLMILSTLLLIGTLLADVLYAIVDPRIRFS